MTMPEAGRQAAHILLDATSAWDVNSSESVNEVAANLALQQLMEVDALIATFDDETDVVTVDATHLLGAGMVLLQYLLQRVADSDGIQREEVIFQVREFVG